MPLPYLYPEWLYNLKRRRFALLRELRNQLAHWMFDQRFWLSDDECKLLLQQTVDSLGETPSLHHAFLRRDELTFAEFEKLYEDEAFLCLVQAYLKSEKGYRRLTDAVVGLTPQEIDLLCEVYRDRTRDPAAEPIRSRVDAALAKFFLPPY